jgi:cation:H+ antiporter
VIEWCAAHRLNPRVLPSAIESLGLSDPLTYLTVFLAASLLMIWRLEAMLDHGLEGTALGTLVMPYCSGLGNILFVLIVTRQGAPAQEVLTNALVNNVSNLTLLLGLPALICGLQVTSALAGPKGRARGKGALSAASGAEINRLSLMLTLVAALFFTGATWLMSEDGVLSRADGAMLIGLFLFWQCFQVFDVLKHNVRQKISFGPMFYVDVVLVLACAWLLYESIDWLVIWISAQSEGFIRAENLGWLTGWLMVLPNALLALYWGLRRRAEVVYSSQVGDGHICIPLCIGLLALLAPVSVSPFFLTGLLLILGTVVGHGLLLLTCGGMPRWAGAVLIAVYAWFLWAGLLS